MTIRPEDELVTIEYVAAALNITRRSVERLIASGTIPIIRLSKKTTRVRRSVLVAFLSARDSGRDQTRQ